MKYKIKQGIWIFIILSTGILTGAVAISNIIYCDRFQFWCGVQHLWDGIAHLLGG